MIKRLRKRRDFRKVTTLTIDPVDAKDFDDALSFKELDDEITEIGVHIADVGHFVKEKSIIDNEAFQRGKQRVFSR
jgi:ribonuclease R